MQENKINKSVKLPKNKAKIEIVKNIIIPIPASNPLYPAKRFKELVVAVIAIGDRLHELADLDKRKEAGIKSLTEQEKLTPDLKKAVMESETLAKLEDIYLPYRPKRRTRGTIAKENGLEPLAEKIFNGTDCIPATLAGEFIDPEKG
ncbi:hypothetical protein EOM09_08845, partial [bacterium]|nr:hypothetical protein [bacterium]